MGMIDFPQRGEIYLVSLDPTIGAEINKTRPALIISNNINNEVSETVTVIPLTSNIEKIYPFETLIPASRTGLSMDSKAKCNQIRTIDKKRLVKPIGRISKDKLHEVGQAVIIHLGIF